MKKVSEDNFTRTNRNSYISLNPHLVCPFALTLSPWTGHSRTQPLNLLAGSGEFFFCFLGASL